MCELQVVAPPPSGTEAPDSPDTSSSPASPSDSPLPRPPLAGFIPGPYSAKAASEVWRSEVRKDNRQTVAEIPIPSLRKVRSGYPCLQTCVLQVRNDYEHHLRAQFPPR